MNKNNVEIHNLEIKTDKCDACGNRAPGVLFYHYGAPVLQQCKHCDSSNFERAARRDIDCWLLTGDTSTLGKAVRS